MHMLYQLDSGGEHVIVTRDEHGDDMRFRASAISLPVKPDSVQAALEAADELARMVEDNYIYFCMKANMTSDVESREGFLKDAAKVRAALDRYQQHR